MVYSSKISFSSDNFIDDLPQPTKIKIDAAINNSNDKYFFILTSKIYLDQSLFFYSIPNSILTELYLDKISSRLLENPSEKDV